MDILTVNLVLSTLIFGLAAKTYVMPKLDELKLQIIAPPILLLHSSRHLGLMFLAPGATYAGIPSQFAYPAAYGDLLAALLALTALAAVVRGARTSRVLLWAFNVEGTLDLLTAITLTTVSGAANYMGPAYWIPAFWVPALLVTHYIMFVILRRQAQASATDPLAGAPVASGEYPPPSR